MSASDWNGSDGVWRAVALYLSSAVAPEYGRALSFQTHQYADEAVQGRASRQIDCGSGSTLPRKLELLDSFFRVPTMVECEESGC